MITKKLLNVDQRLAVYVFPIIVVREAINIELALRLDLEFMLVFKSPKLLA